VLDFAKLRGQSADPARFVRLSRGMTLAWGLVLMGFGLVKWGRCSKPGLTVASLPLRQPGSASFFSARRPRRQRARRPGRNDCGTRRDFMPISIYERGVYLYFMIGALVTYSSAGLRAELRSRKGAENAAPQLCENCAIQKNFA